MLHQQTDIKEKNKGKINLLELITNWFCSSTSFFFQFVYYGIFDLTRLFSHACMPCNACTSDKSTGCQIHNVGSYVCFVDHAFQVPLDPDLFGPISLSSAPLLPRTWRPNQGILSQDYNMCVSMSLLSYYLCTKYNDPSSVQFKFISYS